MYVEDRVKTVNHSALYNIDAVHEAINNKKKLLFKYFDYNGKKVRVFRHNGEAYVTTPLSLMWDDEKYYLVAYDEEAEKIKNFRVDKMKEVSVSDKSADSKKYENFNPADYSRKIFGMYGGREELVTIECRDSLAGAVIDRFGIEPTFTTTDFGFKFSIRVMVSPTFFSWILGFGSDMRIVAPDNVKNELISKLREISENYQ